MKIFLAVAFLFYTAYPRDTIKHAATLEGKQPVINIEVVEQTKKVFLVMVWQSFINHDKWWSNLLHIMYFPLALDYKVKILVDGGVSSTWLLPYLKNMDTRLIRTTANKPRDIYCITFRFG